MNAVKKMRRKTFSNRLTSAFVLATISLGVVAHAHAQTETILRKFNGADGRYPEGAVVFDSNGNLYTTTNGGGSASCGGGFACGVVFELSPMSLGSWQETVIDFLSGAQSGENPSAGLVFDTSGNLYGTTSAGGSLTGCSGTGCGVVFELSPQSDGRWRETVLHTFTGGRDGAVPLSSLIFDAAGNLYGTTSQGGVSGCGGGPGCGTVFELSPDGVGHWHETVLHAFTGGRDGWAPFSSLIFDAAGNLYGNTAAGGTVASCSGTGCGVIFELSPTSGGSWSETVLHSFNGVSDGSDPIGNLVFDSAGNLYGVTFFANTGCDGQGCGTIFELSPTSGGEWKGKGVHVFSGGVDGAYPSAGLVLDAAGNLYGTASRGGGSCGCGVVFKFSPKSSGGWQETLLHTFTGGTADGQLPFASLVFDTAGNLYGTTFGGGTVGYGTVFEITP